jgi:hypothetical protein
VTGASEFCWPFFALGTFGGLRGCLMPDVRTPFGRRGKATSRKKAAAGLPHSKAFSRMILPGMSRRKGRTSVAKMS